MCNTRVGHNSITLLRYASNLRLLSVYYLFIFTFIYVFSLTQKHINASIFLHVMENFSNYLPILRVVAMTTKQKQIN